MAGYSAAQLRDSAALIHDAVPTIAADVAVALAKSVGAMLCSSVEADEGPLSERMADMAAEVRNAGFDGRLGGEQSRALFDAATELEDAIPVAKKIEPEVAV